VSPDPSQSADEDEVPEALLAAELEELDGAPPAAEGLLDEPDEPDDSGEEPLEEVDDAPVLPEDRLSVR